MASDFKCPFCGSESIKVKRLDMGGSEVLVTGEKLGEMDNVYDWCCNAQRQNALYSKKHTDPLTGERPDPEDIGKDYDS